MQPYFTFLFFCFLIPTLQAQETYEMTIEGQSFPVELNKSFTYITESGDSVVFQLTKTGNAVVVNTPAPAQNTFADKGNDKIYEDLMVRFSYPENFAVAKNQPVDGMQQITMVSGQGGGIIIQEYNTIDPKALTDFFLTQLVGEQAASRSEKVNYSLRGQKIKGKFARDEDGSKVVVYSYGKANQGILLALIGEETTDDLLRNFLNGFELKF